MSTYSEHREDTVGPLMNQQARLAIHCGCYTDLKPIKLKDASVHPLLR